MLLLDDVPLTVDYHINGHKLVKDLALSERFEVLVAQEIQGRLAMENNDGFDVYDSRLYPNLTFQVKVANARRSPANRLKNSSNAYSFSGSIEYIADYYILFGIKGNLVNPFVLPLTLWKQHGTKTGKNYKTLSIVSKRFSKRRGALIENQLWNCHISDWPKGLHRRLTQHQQFRQPILWNST